MYEQLLSSVAGAVSGDGGGGGGGSYGTTHDISTPISTPINVSSTGLNLGSILQPLMDGNSNTGGYDLELMSRLGYIANTNPAGPVTGGSMSNNSILGLSPNILLGAGGLVLVLFLFLMRR
jgi:hypothetical protein